MMKPNYIETNGEDRTLIAYNNPILAYIHIAHSVSYTHMTLTTSDLV